MAKKFGQFYNATGLTEVGSVEDIRWSGCGSTLFTLSTQGVVAVSEIAGYDVLSKECDSDAGLLGFIGDHNGGTLAFHTRLVQKANEHSVFRRILPSADKTAFIVDYDGDLHQVRDGSTTHMSWDRPKQGRVYDVSRAGADRLAIIRRDEVSVVDYPTSA
ncbi:hypothetical protein AGDE_14039 [Angomonas deanei]|uniref:Uncharacterized protein n=1 Tax=Angomonas deanei TaxID=59799 RepID=A0A7G2CSU8_9TRYP|nr:hypothetical protein AGDE_14039 [Angomonas deanei]CAD2222886.1 hypothetical protein, conserved [Angomonas deanei]|eukprot:EPY21504.1 hypothetical protein AGDE_14039 [Angomonas deanei]